MEQVGQMQQTEGMAVHQVQDLEQGHQAWLFFQLLPHNTLEL
jgi:hypothetical protein